MAPNAVTPIQLYYQDRKRKYRESLDNASSRNSKHLLKRKVAIRVFIQAYIKNLSIHGWQQNHLDKQKELANQN